LQPGHRCQWSRSVSAGLRQSCSRQSRRSDRGAGIEWRAPLAQSAVRFLQGASPEVSWATSTGNPLPVPRTGAHPDRWTGRKQPFRCPGKGVARARPHGPTLCAGAAAQAGGLRRETRKPGRFIGCLDARARVQPTLGGVHRLSAPQDRAARPFAEQVCGPLASETQCHDGYIWYETQKTAQPAWRGASEHEAGAFSVGSS
jgi:hypothetical protein